MLEEKFTQLQIGINAGENRLESCGSDILKQQPSRAATAWEGTDEGVFITQASIVLKNGKQPVHEEMSDDAGGRPRGISASKSMETAEVIKTVRPASIYGLEKEKELSC